MKLFSKRAARGFDVETIAPEMIQGNIEANFLEHFVNDLGIVLEECRSMNLALKGTSLCHQLYQTLLAA